MLLMLTKEQLSVFNNDTLLDHYHHCYEQMVEDPKLMTLESLEYLHILREMCLERGLL